MPNQIPRTIRFYPHELEQLEAEWKRDQARALVAGDKVPNWNRWFVNQAMSGNPGAIEIIVRSRIADILKAMEKGVTDNVE